MLQFNTFLCPLCFLKLDIWTLEDKDDAGLAFLARLLHCDGLFFQQEWRRPGFTSFLMLATLINGALIRSFLLGVVWTQVTAMRVITWDLPATSFGALWDMTVFPSSSTSWRSVRGPYPHEGLSHPPPDYSTQGTFVTVPGSCTLLPQALLRCPDQSAVLPRAF